MGPRQSASTQRARVLLYSILTRERLFYLECGCFIKTTDFVHNLFLCTYNLLRQFKLKVQLGFKLTFFLLTP